jgi:hypothetical protein
MAASPGSASAESPLEESDHEFFAKAGPLPTIFDDARQFPRFYLRGRARAIIFPPHPSQGTEPVHCTVLTRDLSRGGLGIVHVQQLFPRQRVELELGGTLLVGEIQWCRRLRRHFYLAGCRLVQRAADWSGADLFGEVI